MAHEATQIADVLERLGRDALAQLDGIPDRLLNRPLPLPETNTLFALASHLVGAGEFWTLTLVGGQAIPRDRAAEFHATGTVDDLRARYDRWLAQLRTVCDDLAPEDMDRVIADPAARRPWMGNAPFTVRDSLLHALEHTALHLGHIQLTRQILRSDPDFTEQ